jgi:hypothetical protein
MVDTQHGQHSICLTFKKATKIREVMDQFDIIKQAYYIAM